MKDADEFARAIELEAAMLWLDRAGEELSAIWQTAWEGDPHALLRWTRAVAVFRERLDHASALFIRTHADRERAA